MSRGPRWPHAGHHHLAKGDKHPPPERALEKVPELRVELAKVNKLYERSMRAMVRDIGEYIERATERAVKKSDEPGPGFATPAQMAAIYEIIKRHHAHVVVESIGVEAVPPDVLVDLKRAGLVPQNASESYGYRVIDGAYKFGREAARRPPPVPVDARRPAPPAGGAGGAGAAPPAAAAPPGGGRREPPRLPPGAPPPAPPPPPTLGPTGHPLPDLTRSEQLALEYAKQRAGQYITGLTDAVARDVHGLTVEAGEAMRADYRAAIVEAIAQRKAWGEVRSELGHSIGEWCRDLDRVVATEMHGAYQHGKAGEIRELHGEDARVFKRPAPDACDDCVRLHLTGGAGSPPKIFRLSKLLANGTNVGRKRSSWKAVIDTVHPWCACELNHVPDGYGFDEEGDLVPESMATTFLDPDDDDENVIVVQGSLLRGDSAPEPLLHGLDRGCAVHIADPVLSTAVQAVVDAGPPQIFGTATGVSIITADNVRAANHLRCGDKAYQVGNEVRIAHDLPIAEVRRVVRHELAHGLNIYLRNRFGGQDAVIKWHKYLFGLSSAEGFVSDYASTSPIENAAEVTANYVWARMQLRTHYPAQYSCAHRAYADLFATSLAKARKLEGRMVYQGLLVSIETDKGSERHWYDPASGESGTTKMLHPYGYIRGSHGVDGDHVDVYVGPDHAAEDVFIITQMKRPRTVAERERPWTKVDEQKVMLGFGSAKEAKDAYLKHYNDPRFFGSMERMPFAKFRQLVLDKQNHGKLI